MQYSIASIRPLCDKFQEQGKVVVLATGFFDLLHREHLNFLTKAKASGDILIVAVESDERARLVKGPGRPIESQSVRCQKLLALPSVDYVVALGRDFNRPAAYESLLAAIRPAIYAVSSHTSHLDIKQKLVEKHGGRLLVVHSWNPEISTTQIIANNNQL